MKVGICYVCPIVKWDVYEPIVRRFLAAYQAFPPGHDHEFHVIFNGGSPTSHMVDMFSGMNPICHEHDNTGWDIGAFSKMTDVACDEMLFLGTNTNFRRAGWLQRVIDARQKFGTGLFGTSASYDIYPHIRTNGYLCQPKLVGLAWAKNRSRTNPRHGFELGKSSLTDTAAGQGLPVVLVTWGGYYTKDEWRKAPNIYRRGNQSNCLIYDRHHEIYEASSPRRKIQLERIADGNKFEYYRAAIKARLQRWFPIPK
jgi:hypothetical protein